MSDTFWQRHTRLYRYDGPDGGGSPAFRGEPVAATSLGNVARMLIATPSDEWWRYAIETDDQPHITSDELRSILARDDIPAAKF